MDSTTSVLEDKAQIGIAESDPISLDTELA